MSCSWRDIYLTGGNNYTDKSERIRAENAVHAMMNDVGNGKGVRIHLAPTVSFEHLIFALNTLNRENVKKYWLDIHHTPTTLYAFEEPSDPPVIPLQDGCLLCGDVVHYVPPVPPDPFWIRFDDAVTEFWRFRWFRPLLKTEWRASNWLLALIAVIGTWRVIRAWRAA